MLKIIKSFIISELIVNHLGKKPIKGGSPPILRKLILIENFTISFNFNCLNS